jgi:hypothetical protein
MGSLTYNLSDNPAQYNISVCKVKPVIKIDPENLAMPEWMQFEGAPYLTGLGYIVDSEAEFYKMVKRTPKT